PYRKEATKLRDYYSRPRLGEFEATFRQHAAFGGRVFPAEVVDVLKPILTEAGSKWSKNLAQISGTSRMLVAALDLSAPFIQGLLVFGRNPVAWAKAVGKMFQIAKDPRKLYTELAKREATRLDRILHGGSSAMIDYFEAMPVLRKVARVIGKEPGEKLVAQTYGRAEAAFLGFGELARDELWRAGSFAIRKKGLTEAVQNTQLDDLARTLDRMTGVMSMERLGIGLSQRQFESAWIFFAPRYTRAGFSIMGDMLLKGGITGAEARTAMAGFMGGGLTMYMGACHALGQQPNFDPRSARFMTVEIAGRHIGVGGFQYSMMRFLANVAATAVEDPGMLSPLNLSRFDNPFYKFMYSKAAPLTGTLMGLAIEHRNYFGEPFESPADYMAFLADKITPIAMQPMMPWAEEEGALTPTTFVAEMGGLRTFPESDWERRNDLRDKLAQDQYGMTWDEVGTLKGEAYQLEIERDSSDLQELTQIAQETSARLARGEGKIWSDWRSDMADIQGHRQEAIELAAREFETTGDGIRFREKVNAIENVRREMYSALKRNSRYAEVYEYFDEPLEKDVLEKMNPKDIARREYYKGMYADDMYDEFGDYRFDEADRREAAFVQRYGQGALDYIEKYSGAKWEEPQALRLLRTAKNILEPYREIEGQIWARYSPELKGISDQINMLEKTDPRQAKILLMRNPSILMARKLIASQRKMLKLRNPDIQTALRLFYTY
ncbi:MAG: hypothetical protein H8E40_04015, partial [Chloroflexi bacterium]|nr:hypothetical protein [Chloroflexota bacterium]